MWAFDEMRTALVLIILSGPAAGDPFLSGDAFAAHVGQDTIRYGYSTGARGTADYGPDRTLVWSFEGEPCFNGRWFPRGAEICFAFEDGTLSACWHMTLGANGLVGVMTEPFYDIPAPVTIFETSRTKDPVSCLAPEVGV